MKKTLLFSLLLATGTSAFGQLYFGAGAAYIIDPGSQIIDSSGSSIDDTIGGMANIGYKVPSNGWHFEFEFQYFEPDSEASMQLSGAQSAAATGTNLGNGLYTINSDGESMAFMGNIYYDILATMETNWGIYFGGGLGFINLKQDLRVNGPGGSVSSDDDTWLFTYQALGGISYTPISHLRFDLAYRFTQAGNSSLTLFNQYVAIEDYRYQSIELSASYMF